MLGGLTILMALAVVMFIAARPANTRPYEVSPEAIKIMIATDGMFGMDGDVAPLREIVELGHRYDVRVLVDEAHALALSGGDDALARSLMKRRAELDGEDSSPGVSGP